MNKRLILDNGYLSIHWPILDVGKAGGDNVLILPGVSLTEALVFVDFLYGRQNTISNAYFTYMFLGFNNECLQLWFCEHLKEKWQFDLSENC